MAGRFSAPDKTAGPAGPAAAGSPTDGNSRHDRRELFSLMSAPVDQAPLRPPVWADGDSDLVTLCRELAAKGVSDALIRDGDRVGMFTATNLRDALLSSTPPGELPVRDIASFPVVAVDAGDELFDAMIAMLRHRVHQVVVRRDGEIIGLLGQLDLVAFVSSASHLISHEIDAASSVAALRDAAGKVTSLIRLLHGDGVRVGVIARLVGALNRQIFRRLWELLAPPDLLAQSCLIVMGSEGRSEQVIRTDQDNGLILRDGHAADEVAQATAAFTAALVDFGYPECPGGIMVSRPDWCQDVTGWRQTIGGWLYGEDPEGPMKLAIFLDAAPVAGDPALLTQVRAHLDRLLTDNDHFMARFAAAVNNFQQPSSWWSRLPGIGGDRAGAEIDIKKLGIFPIVQGVRALALQNRLADLSTRDRLRALVAAGRIDADRARDLGDALRFLIGMKLDHNLRQLDQGRTPGNLVRLDDLGTLDRQALKDSLAIVRDFRAFVSQHFRLAG